MTTQTTKSQKRIFARQLHAALSWGTYDTHAEHTVFEWLNRADEANPHNAEWFCGCLQNFDWMRDSAMASFRQSDDRGTRPAKRYREGFEIWQAYRAALQMEAA